MSNPDQNKLDAEYKSQLANNSRTWLRIRFVPGMEMLAQELATGRRLFEQEPLPQSPASPASPGSPSPASPTSPASPASPLHHHRSHHHGESCSSPSPICPSPASPSCSPSPCSPHSPCSPYSPCSPSPGYSPSPLPVYRPGVSRRRSQRWMLDATGSFPSLFIPEELVAFYSNLTELQQAMATDGPADKRKVVINTANVVTVEKITIRQSYAQNLTLPDVAEGVAGQQPPVRIDPLVVLAPTEIPAVTRPDIELMFQIVAKGGNAPYRYTILNAPKDLYVTEDGWVRGHIDEDQWPARGFREFLVLILVDDSSIPAQTTGLEFRYRLHAPA